MAYERYLLNFRVAGDKRNLAMLLRLLKLMDMLGSQGSSRRIEIYYDGDGAARLRFEVEDEKEEGGWRSIEKEFVKGIDTDTDEPIKIDFD